MKNLILGAASVLAISVTFAAHAQTPAPSAPTDKTAVPANKPAAPTPAPLLAPGTPPAKVMAPATAPAMPLKKPAMPEAQAPKMNPSQPCPVHPPKHHAHKKHHHKHHPHHMAPVPPMVEEYVTFPPAQGCNLEYYWGTSTYPYAYYGGYFWYPHNNATVLAGYTPSYWNGYYWYASRMHPHMLYVEGQVASYVIPLNMTRRPN